MQFTIPQGLHIRPSKPSDTPFIEKLHREVRQDLQCIEGEQDFIESIVDMQLKAQTQGYGAQYPNAMYFIIEKNGEPIGKATLDFGHNEIRLIDIGFLIAARGHGFGRAIIQSFQHCAAQSAVPLTLSVLSHNLVVKRLYLELGFQVSEVQSPYELMIWYPPAMKQIVGV
ncbi:GNAT family N-acetyltransferase [Pseudoalteromonas phenolica]|nr:GNAT family N-acetyltransferase [Pseudoalteromonas phenolica]